MDTSAYFDFAISQKIKKDTNKTSKRGKKNASREIIHHLSGCRNELQQDRRKRKPTPKFSRIKKRMENFRSEVMRKNR
jgi:hypothetical protein